MNDFPVDVRCIHRSKGYLRDLMQQFWGSWTAILPWRLRVALWNWIWDLKGDERVRARRA